jgi:valyl-tRNA synthetase
LQRVIGEIRSVRQDMNVPASAKINLLVKGADNTVVSNLNAHKLVMQKMARLEEFEFVSNMPKGAVQTVVGDTTYGLPVADIIDLDKERARLQKEIGKLQKDIKQIEGKLNNKGFVQNAPDDVIEEQKHRKVEAVQIIEKLESALKQIG